MKKGFIFGMFTIVLLIVLMGAGTKVFDIRRSDSGGIAYFDSIVGTLQGGINSATSDITVDDVTCNTVTPDTVLGLVLFADSIKDLRIAKGYELSVDSAVIDTLDCSIGTIASIISGTKITSAKDSTIVLKVMSGMSLADTVRILDVDTFGTDKTCDTFVNTKIATGAFAFVTWKTQPDSATAISAICLTDTLFVTTNKAETGGIYQFMIINP